MDTFKGKALKGKRYQPLFTFVPVDKPANFVVQADFVTTEDGTGLVHIAPAYGADDMQLALDRDLPMIMAVDDNGAFTQAIRPWKGKFVKDADPFIIEDLKARGLLFRAGTITHTYPFCWRCSTPLLYYARPTWYIRTTQFKTEMVKLNQEINWYPGHIKNGRFGNWLANNVDWALGRERYWGTPLPVWECGGCHHQICVGSVAQLSELAGRDLTSLDLHRPFVDGIHFTCQECGGEMRREPEVIDVWFDSGSMPVAQWHFPFDNQMEFRNQFPADYICEAVDQTRGWFYSLHAISTMLYESVAFRNVISLGLVLDAEGQKMSKSKGNVVDPWEVINEHGADATRWYLYTATPPGQERRFSKELVGEVVRNFLLPLWNTYSFFVTYANLDHWKPDEQTSPPQYSDLDRWLLSALNGMVRDVTEAMEHYDVPGATRPIETFVGQLSNWYLRRSRRRFWKSEADGDKQAAYSTLYRALVTLSKLLAPTMPFIAEELYQNLVHSALEESKASIHLEGWPEYDLTTIDETLNQGMGLVMKLASLGHAARNKANRKVRQPLSEAVFLVGNPEEQRIVEWNVELLKDELNVKRVRLVDIASEAVSYTLNPNPKQLGQKYGKRFPVIREAILGLAGGAIAQDLLAGKAIHLTLDGEMLEILPEDIEVRIKAREGFAVASEGRYLAAVKTELTPELIREGLAREFVRRVQDLRKQMDLDIANRIKIFYQATPRLREAIDVFRAYIMGETLAIGLEQGQAPGSATVVEFQFEGEELSVGVLKA